MKMAQAQRLESMLDDSEEMYILSVLALRIYDNSVGGFLMEAKARSNIRNELSDLHPQDKCNIYRRFVHSAKKLYDKNNERSEYFFKAASYFRNTFMISAN